MSRHVAIAMLLTALFALPTSARGLVDPTRPPQARAAAPGTAPGRASLRLSSILVAPARRLAIINEAVVGEGEQVGGVQVLEIGPYTVKVLVRGTERTLRLSETAVKRIPEEER